MYSLKIHSAPDQSSMSRKNGQNLVHVAAIAFCLEKQKIWANAHGTRESL